MLLRNVAKWLQLGNPDEGHKVVYCKFEFTQNKLGGLPFPPKKAHVSFVVLVGNL